MRETKTSGYCCMIPPNCCMIPTNTITVITAAEMNKHPPLLLCCLRLNLPADLVAHALLLSAPLR